MTANTSPGPAHNEISDAVAACFGPSAVTYLLNKARGGASGKKGAEYEQQFTTAKVVALLNDQCHSSDRQWPVLEQQAMGFVDDLVIRKPAGAHYHQLKNTQSLSWHDREHPLATDFAWQVKLCCHLKSAPATTTLVVSSQTVCKTMQDSMPSAIAPHSTVEHFPYVGPSFNKLVLTHAPLRQALALLTTSDQPKDDDLVHAFAALMIGTISADGPVSVQSIVAKAQNMRPATLRLFPWDLDKFELDDQFVKVLEKIPGLAYGVVRGFFRCEALGMSSVFPYNCLDPKFAKFQSIVIKNSPSTYEEFEGFLP